MITCQIFDHAARPALLESLGDSVGRCVPPQLASHRSRLSVLRLVVRQCFDFGVDCNQARDFTANCTRICGVRLLMKGLHTGAFVHNPPFGRKNVGNLRSVSAISLA